MITVHELSCLPEASKTWTCRLVFPCRGLDIFAINVQWYVPNILSINNPLTVSVFIGFLLTNFLHTSKMCDVAMSSPSFSGTLLCGAHLRPGLRKDCSIGCSSSEESLETTLALSATCFVFLLKYLVLHETEMHMVHVYGRIMRFPVEPLVCSIFYN